MKRIGFKKIMIAFLAILVTGMSTISSCTKEKVVHESRLKSTNPDYGKLHNQFLIYCMGNFDETMDFDSVRQVVEYVNYLNIQYSKILGLRESFIYEFNNHKNFLSSPDFIDSLFVGTRSLFKSIETLYTVQCISENDYKQLCILAELFYETHLGKVAWEETPKYAKPIIYNGVKNSDSQIAFLIFDIAKNSMDFWEDYPCHPYNGHENGGYVTVHPLAMDAAGAVIGAALSAGSQYVMNDGSVNGNVVAVSAVSGAIVASTGLVAKTGAAIEKAAVKAGKFLSKIIKK